MCLRHTLRAWTPGRLRGCAARALLPQPARDTACIPSSPGRVPPIHLPPLAGSSQAEPENRAPCPCSAHCRANEVDRVPLSWRPEQEGGPAGGQSDGPGHPRADPSAQGHSHTPPSTEPLPTACPGAASLGSRGRHTSGSWSSSPWSGPRPLLPCLPLTGTHGWGPHSAPPRHSGGGRQPPLRSCLPLW